MLTDQITPAVYLSDETSTRSRLEITPTFSSGSPSLTIPTFVAAGLLSLAAIGSVGASPMYVKEKAEKSRICETATVKTYSASHDNLPTLEGNGNDDILERYIEMPVVRSIKVTVRKAGKLRMRPIE